MVKKEMERARRVLESQRMPEAARRLSERMERLTGEAPMPLRRQMNEMADEQQALNQRLSEVEHWVDGGLDAQMEMLAGGQAILQAKLEQMASMTPPVRPQALPTQMAVPSSLLQ